MLEDAIKRVVSLKRMLSKEHCSTISSHNFIVVDDFGPLMFKGEEVDAGKFKFTAIGHATSTGANRFRKEDAIILAEACKAKIMFWEDVAKEELALLENFISFSSKLRDE